MSYRRKEVKGIKDLWNELLLVNPSNDNLIYIIEYVEPLREQARKLVKRIEAEIMRDIKNF